MLGRFGLSGHHHLVPIVKLSGGQKARVVFTAISLSQPHILLLVRSLCAPWPGWGSWVLSPLFLAGSVAFGPPRSWPMRRIANAARTKSNTQSNAITNNTDATNNQPPTPKQDEPTNHLDMQSIDALCDAVEAFEGGVVVISHDAQLLSKICADEERSEVWIVDNGEITPYDGDFEDYRDELTKEIAAGAIFCDLVVIS